MNHWFHIDGALGAGYMPYAEMLYKKENKEWKYDYDFRLKEVCSIVISGHKWMGTPWPTGIYVMRKSLMVG
jgi:histidine decarboxylase